MKLPLFHSQLSIKFATLQIASKYIGNARRILIGMSGGTEHIQKSFTNRCVDINQDRVVFRELATPFEASYDDEAENNLQLKLTDHHCRDELRSKFKEGNLFNFYKCFPKDKYPNLQLCVQGFPEALPFVNKLSQ
jgi:hypothetical protein